MNAHTIKNATSDMTAITTTPSRRRCLQAGAALVAAICFDSSTSWAKSLGSSVLLGGGACSSTWQPFDPLLAADCARTPRPKGYPLTFEAWLGMQQTKSVEIHLLHQPFA